VRATAAGGRGAVVVVPDARDLARVTAALAEQGVAAASLSADLGPAVRYRRWLSVLRGGVQVAVGTRATAFAPVRDLGLVVVWDDGDDLHAEPRAPYPHVREVLVARAHLAGAAVLVGGHARTAEAQLLVESGWARPLEAARAVVRAHAPHVDGTSDDQLARDPQAQAAAAGRGLRRRPPGRSPTGRRCSCRCRAAATSQPGVRARPHAGPVRALRRTARLVVRRRRRGLPVVRPPGRRLALPRVRRLAAALVGRRRRTDGRGARPGLPRHAGADVRARRGARDRPGAPALVVSTPGPSRSPTAATARCSCSTAGRRWPCRPAGGGGGAAAVVRRGGPRAARRTGRLRRRPRARAGAGAGALGPRRCSRPRARRAHRARLPARRAPGVGAGAPAAVAEVVASLPTRPAGTRSAPSPPPTGRSGCCCRRRDGRAPSSPPRSRRHRPCAAPARARPSASSSTPGSSPDVRRVLRTH
jgi:primosomal protein N' (replication factor Y)